MKPVEHAEICPYDRLHKQVGRVFFSFPVLLILFLLVHISVLSSTEIPESLAPAILPGTDAGEAMTAQDTAPPQRWFNDAPTHRDRAYQRTNLRRQLRTILPGDAVPIHPVPARFGGGGPAGMHIFRHFNFATQQYQGNLFVRAGPENRA